MVFLPFIKTVKKIFQFGYMSGGIHTDPQQIFYHQQYSKASIPTYSKPKDYTMSRQYSSTENSRFHGFSVGVTELLNIIVLPTNFLRVSSENSKLNGGANLIKLSVRTQQLLNSSPPAKNSNIIFNKLPSKRILPLLQNPSSTPRRL